MKKKKKNPGLGFEVLWFGVLGLGCPGFGFKVFVGWVLGYPGFGFKVFVG